MKTKTLQRIRCLLLTAAVAALTLGVSWQASAQKKEARLGGGLKHPNHLRPGVAAGV